MSIIVFLSTIKFMKLLRFNKRIGMLSSTLAVAAKPVAQFMMMFMCIFTGYTLMAYVMFNTYSRDFSSFITTMQTLFSAMLSKLIQRGTFHLIILISMFTVTKMSVCSKPCSSWLGIHGLSLDPDCFTEY